MLNIEIGWLGIPRKEITFIKGRKFRKCEACLGQSEFSSVADMWGGWNEMGPERRVGARLCLDYIL